VRRFVEDTHALGDRTPEQWQQDAFGQIDALLRAMTLRAWIVPNGLRATSLAVGSAHHGVNGL